MDQRPVAGQGCLPRLALTLLLLVLLVLLAGCAGQSTSPSATRGSSIAGQWITIQRGDTLGGIAQRANVPLIRLKRFNPGIQPSKMAVGQKVLVPSPRERAPSGGPYRYQIRRGDTFSSVARRFATNPQRMMAANPGLSPTDLKVGQLIQVPLGSARTASSGSRPAPKTLPDPGKLPSKANGWPWPLDDYQVSRRFGKDSNGTLQPMLLSTKAGSRAKAVASGQVRFADRMRQLGQVVIVHHPDNLQSVYAQCGRLLVKDGQRITRGTPVCEVGDRHELLFDMRHGGKPINPERILR